MAGPLTGVRVVEVAAIGPVPHAAMVLADLGADVVRVDRTTQAAGGVVRPEGDLLARGRRVVRLDLKQPDARATFLDLVARADVLLEGFRPGVAERLRLGPQDCSAVNPRLVYGRMTGWGQHGVRASTAGHDLNYLSVTGTLAALGPAGGPPQFPMNLLADFGGGSMLLLVGVLAALVERSRSGLGQVVDAAMVDGVALLSQMMWALRGQGEWSDRPGTNLLDGGAPFYAVYACADGRYVAVAALERPFYDQLVAGLGLDPAALPDRDDRATWPELRRSFAEVFASRPRDAWAAQFDGTDACVTPVVEPAEAVDEPHLRSRGTLVTVDGRVQAAPAPRFARTPTDPPHPLRAGDEPVADVLASWPARTRPTPAA
jgi:alpha-methylacyl-CoA racemase